MKFWGSDEDLEENSEEDSEEWEEEGDDGPFNMITETNLEGYEDYDYDL